MDNELRIQSDPPPYEQEIMLKFVEEYSFDKDPRKAALRIGITAVHAQTVADKFMNSPFVQGHIKKRQYKDAIIVQDPEKLKQELIINLMNIVRYDGEAANPSARVAAAKTIAQLTGIEAPKQETATQISNIMLIPSPMSVDDWSSVAQTQQSKLQKDLEASLVS
jgi:hypothetical protein